MLGEEEPRTGWSAIGGRRQRGWSVPKQVCGEVLLAKEQDTRKGGLFAATPPNHGSTGKVMLLDVSKAHLYTTRQDEEYAELPPEKWKKENARS